VAKSRPEPKITFSRASISRASRARIKWRMMNGIECPAIDANFFQDNPVNPLINEIWPTLTAETRDIASPRRDNARRRNAALQLPPNRRAAVNL